jgi:hypothetical protein
MHMSDTGTSLNIPFRQKCSSCSRIHSRTAISTSSLFCGMGQVHQCARGWCWKTVIRRWNKWAPFNVMTWRHVGGGGGAGVVKLDSVLTSALYGGAWSASRLGWFTPSERTSGAHWTGGRVGPTASLGLLERGRISCHCRDRTTVWRSSSP